MEVDRRIYALVHYTIVAWDNGLLPGRHRAIIWTNTGILLTWPIGKYFIEILFEIHKFPSRKCIWICRVENSTSMQPNILIWYIGFLSQMQQWARWSKRRHYII